MTRDEAIAFIQNKLGFRTGLSTTIQTDLVAAQTYLESGAFNQAWFLVSPEITVDCVAGQRSIALPSDFLVEYEESGLYYRPADGTDDQELAKDDFDELRSIFTANATGLPQAYSLDGLEFNLWPKPDAVYTFAYRYCKRGDDLTTSPTNVWLTHAPMVLIGQAGLFTAQGLNNPGALGFFQSLMAQASSTLVGQNEARKHANREYQIGGPEN